MSQNNFMIKTLIFILDKGVVLFIHYLIIKCVDSLPIKNKSKKMLKKIVLKSLSKKLSEI